MAAGEVQEPCVRVLFSLRENVRLGQGLKENNVISPHTLHLAISTLKRFKKVLEDHSIHKVRAVGTAALRNADNAHVLLESAKSLGMPVDVIDWREEATLAVKGACNALGGVDSPWAMIDVGGGSTEIVVCKGNEVLKGCSIDIGAVSLLEAVSNHMAPDAKMLTERARQLLLERLAQTSIPRSGLRHAVGTGGTATTVAAVDRELEVYDAKRIRGHVISLRKLYRLLNRMAGLDLNERQRIKGLEPQRADIFPAGIAILSEIVSYLELNELIVSDGGLLSGLFAAFIEKECNFYVEPSCARSIYL